MILFYFYLSKISNAGLLLVMKYFDMFWYFTQGKHLNTSSTSAQTAYLNELAGSSSITVVDVKWSGSTV